MQQAGTLSLTQVHQVFHTCFDGNQDGIGRLEALEGLAFMANEVAAWIFEFDHNGADIPAATEDILRILNEGVLLCNELGIRRGYGLDEMG